MDEALRRLVRACKCNDLSDVSDILYRDQYCLTYAEHPNHPSQTFLHVAAAHYRAEIVECLLEHGADVEAQDEDGRTPSI